MMTLTWITVGVMATLLVGQGVLVARFVLALRSWPPAWPQDAAYPKVAVLLCLRGADPFLAKTLEALWQLDYPRYELWIWGDHPDDDGFQLATQILSAKANDRLLEDDPPRPVLRLRTLQNRRKECTLKCSSLVEAAAELDGSFFALALVDADTVPHRTWLRDLIRPLLDEKIGAATSNRWYFPEEASWGAVVRYFWNAAAIVVSYTHRLGWGGTLSIKREVLAKTDLLARWARAFCEDTMVGPVLRKHGWKLAFVPSLMMVNREDCTLAGCVSWMRRQLLATKLYHASWPGVVAHGVVTVTVPILGIALAIALATTGIWLPFAAMVMALLGYSMGEALMLLPMERAIREIVRRRCEPTNWVSRRMAARIVPGIMLTRIIYTVALLSVIGLRKVVWRGVVYRVRGPQDVTMEIYSSYPRQTAGRRSSL